MSLRGKIKTVILWTVVLALLLSPKVSAKRPCRKHANSEMKIALTFDDGPDERYTAEILDILAEYGVRATFFVIGSNCERHPELVRREIKEGHEIGNHTYSHPHLSSLNVEGMVAELKKAEDVLKTLSGYRPRLFRPPEGVYSSTVAKAIESLDYIPVLWTVDTCDWKMPSADTIAERVLSCVEPGVIILCHDYVSGKSNTPAALRLFLPKLLSQGYVFVTVSELLQSR